MSGRIQDRAWGLAGGGSKPPNKAKRSARYRTVHPGVRREVPFLKPTTPVHDSAFDFTLPRLPLLTTGILIPDLSRREDRQFSMENKSRFQIISLNNSDARVRDYKKRKAHKKTKSGCLPCRAKRVKCDESRPICARCQRNSRTCAYGEPHDGWQLSSRGTPLLDPYDITKFSILSAVTVDPFCSSTGNGTSTIVLMQHFQRHWIEIFHIPHNEEIVSLYKSSSLLRNTMLAITACHLRHVSPGVLQHRIAEHFQQALALRDYQTVLCMSQEHLDQPSVDALFLSAMLLNILAFALPQSETNHGEPDPTMSWVFSPQEGRLNWLWLQMGLRPLLKSMSLYLDKTMSFLSRVFLGPGQEPTEFITIHHGLEGVPESWNELLQLDGHNSGCDSEATSRPPNANDNSPHPGDIFHAPVKIISMLRRLEPTGPNIFKSLVFLSKINGNFRTLLYHRDERSLWLFGYWLGLMCRFDGVWWCDKRVRMDYYGIYLWLSKVGLTERPGAEGQMWRELMMDLELAPTLNKHMADNTVAISQQGYVSQLPGVLGLS